MKSKTTSRIKKAVSSTKKAANSAVSTGVNAVKQNPNILLNAALIGGGIWLIFKVVNGFSKQITKTISPDLTTNVNTGGVTVNTNRTTISREEAQVFAQQLLDAMNQVGTDTSTIKSVFDKINAEDFKLIFNAFGLVDYNGFGVPNDNIFIIFDSFQKRDLVFWLKSELNSVFDAITFNKVKNIVQQAGFAF